MGDQSKMSNCSTTYLAAAIKNNTLGNGVGLNRGVSMLLGGQPQGFRLTFFWQNLAIENSQDCSGEINSASNITACIGQKGGVFYIDKSSSWRVAPDDGWNGTAANPADHNGHTLLGWDTVVLSGNVAVPGTPVVVWSDSTSNNKTAFGLGSNSSTIQAFVKQGVLPSFPKQLGIYMGSRSELQGADGEIIFGGFDAARVNGSFTWFPIGTRYPGLDCPLQVLLDDVVVTNTNGSQSLFADNSSRIPACIDPIQNAFTFSEAMYQKWAAITGHPETQPRDGSSPYTEQTYPGGNENLIGGLSLVLSNDQGSNYSSTIPHYEMYSHERGSDAQGIYTIINATRGMAAVISPLTGFMGVPLLGGTFLSQNYLVIDYERGVFGLAPAILGKMDASQRRVACLPKTSAPGHTTHEAIPILAAFMAVTVAILAVLFFLFLFKKLRKHPKTSRETSISLDNRKPGSLEVGIPPRTVAREDLHILPSEAIPHGQTLELESPTSERRQELPSPTTVAHPRGSITETYSGRRDSAVTEIDSGRGGGISIRHGSTSLSE